MASAPDHPDGRPRRSAVAEPLADGGGLDRADPPDRLPGGGPKDPSVAPSNDWDDERPPIGANGEIDLGSSFTFGQKPQLKPRLYSTLRKSSPELRNASDHILGKELRARGCTPSAMSHLSGWAKRVEVSDPAQMPRGLGSSHPGWDWPEIKKETPENRLHAIQSTWWTNP